MGCWAKAMPALPVVDGCWAMTNWLGDVAEMLNDSLFLLAVP